MMREFDEETGEVLTTKQTTLPAPPAVTDSMAVAISKAQLDQQVTTAKAHPRSYQKFLDQSRELVCLSVEIAESCNFALPRGGKKINGASVRFAEIIAGRYGNCISASRVLGEDGDFIVAEGFFHDLETNSITRTEARRRIVDKNGNKYNVDMIGMTANAAASVARRNAILQGIGKGMWEPLYESALKVAKGSLETLEARRARTVEAFKKLGVTEAEIFASVGVKGLADIGLDELATLRALGRQIQNNEISVKDAFRPEAAAPTDESKNKVEDELRRQDEARTSQPPPEEPPSQPRKRAAPKPTEPPASEDPTADL